MYPKVILTRPIRRTIMGFLILSFFIISPLTLLYTAGYRYDWKTHRILYTGVVSVDIETDDAQVFLDGILRQENKPNVITQRIHTKYRFANVKPGIHRVAIKKPGYKTWEQDIEVESNRTSYIKGFELIKESAAEPIPFLATSTTVNIVPSYDGAYILAVERRDTVYDIRLYQRNTNRTETILRKISEFQPVILWSPFRNHAAVVTMEKKQMIFSVFQAHEPNRIRTHALPSSLPEISSDSLHWQKIAALPRLYLRQKQDIILLTDQEKRIVGNVSGDAWYPEDQHVIWQYNEKTQMLEQYKNGALAAEFESPFEIQRIIAVYPTHVIVQTQNEINIARLKPGRLVGVSEITGGLSLRVRYNHALEKKEWLAWSPWEVWSMKEDGAAALLYRASEAIDEVFPLDEHGMLFIVFKNQTAIAFNPGYSVSQTLIGGQAISNIGVDTEKREVLFLGEGGIYYRLEF